MTRMFYTLCAAENTVDVDTPFDLWKTNIYVLYYMKQLTTTKNIFDNVCFIFYRTYTSKLYLCTNKAANEPRDLKPVYGM